MITKEKIQQILEAHIEDKDVKKCNKCGYKWYSKIKEPLACPSCRTRLYKSINEKLMLKWLEE